MSEKENNNRAGFQRAQWRMLFATMFCYLFYYTGRHNWGWVVKALHDDLGLSPLKTGWIAGAMLAAYGFGQFVNGNLGDKFGGRRLMSLGALLSCCLCWVTSFGQSFLTLLIPWTANGYVQSLGWAPGSRLISNWWEHEERGKAFGFYMLASGFSAVLTFALCITILQYLSWRWVFRLPVLLLLGGGVVFYLVARDRPEDLGFETVNGNTENALKTGENTTSLQRYLRTFRNRRFLIACVVIGFQNMARYGLVFWVPFYYLGDNWKQEPGRVWITLALPVGMALGGISAGQLSDRLFRSNRSVPVILFLALAAVATLSIYFIPREQYLLGMVFLFLAGFFVYGAQAPLWALCPDLLGIQCAGTGVGVMDASAYAFAAVQMPFYGWVIQSAGEEYIFVITAIVCCFGAACMLMVRK